METVPTFLLSIAVLEGTVPSGIPMTCYAGTEDQRQTDPFGQISAQRPTMSRREIICLRV